MKKVSFRNKIIIKLLGAVAVSFFVSFGLTILTFLYVIIPLNLNHYLDDLSTFENNMTYISYIRVSNLYFYNHFFNIGSKENSIFEAHF